MNAALCDNTTLIITIYFPNVNHFLNFVFSRIFLKKCGKLQQTVLKLFAEISFKEAF